MKSRRIAAVYSIFIGVSMIGMWTVLLGTGQVPEINTEPINILFTTTGLSATWPFSPA